MTLNIFLEIKDQKNFLTTFNLGLPDILKIIFALNLKYTLKTLVKMLVNELPKYLVLFF